MIDREKVIKALRLMQEWFAIHKGFTKDKSEEEMYDKKIERLEEAMELLKEQEGRIVKCRECIHSIPCSYLDEYRRCSKNDGYWADDDYCSKGKRRSRDD